MPSVHAGQGQGQQKKMNSNELEAIDGLSLKNPNNEGFTGKFPEEFQYLKDPGELDRPLYLISNC